MELSEQGKEFARLSNLSTCYLTVIMALQEDAPLSVITLLRRRRQAVLRRMKTMTEELIEAKRTESLGIISHSQGKSGDYCALDDTMETNIHSQISAGVDDIESVH